jgi:hypothetical protein
MRKLTIIVGSLLLVVATAAVLSWPLVATVCSLAAAGASLLLKRYRGDEANDVTVLSRIVLLSGCLAILTVQIAAAGLASERAVVHLTRLAEDIFFNFGAFIFGYAFVCFIVFLSLLARRTS